MAKLGDERVALIADYAQGLRPRSPTPSPTSWRARRWTSRRGGRRLKAKYYEKVKAALSPRTALRFLQVEQQLLLLIDLQIVRRAAGRAADDQEVTCAIVCNGDRPARDRAGALAA